MAAWNKMFSLFCVIKEFCTENIAVQQRAWLICYVWYKSIDWPVPFGDRTLICLLACKGVRVSSWLCNFEDFEACFWSCFECFGFELFDLLSVSLRMHWLLCRMQRLEPVKNKTWFSSESMLRSVARLSNVKLPDLSAGKELRSVEKWCWGLLQG